MSDDQFAIVITASLWILAGAVVGICIGAIINSMAITLILGMMLLLLLTRKGRAGRRIFYDERLPEDEDAFTGLTCLAIIPTLLIFFGGLCWLGTTPLGKYLYGA